MPIPPRRYSEQAFLTWFRRELLYRYPVTGGKFTIGQVAHSCAISIPTSRKYLNRLAGQGELEIEDRKMPNGITAHFYGWRHLHRDEPE